MEIESELLLPSILLAFIGKSEAKADNAGTTGIVVVEDTATEIEAGTGTGA